MTFDMKEFTAGLTSSLQKAVAGEDTSAVTLESIAKSVEAIAGRLDVIEKSINGEGDEKPGVAKSVEAVATDNAQFAEVLEVMLKRLDTIEGRTAVSKQAAGQDATEEEKPKRVTKSADGKVQIPTGMFDGALRAMRTPGAVLTLK